MALKDRRFKSFAQVVETCEQYNCEPLFDFDNYYGQSRNNNGKVESNYYSVRCKVCGTEFQSWFKSAEHRMMKCPSCYEGHKNSVVSYQSVVAELQSLGLKPLFNESEFHSKTTAYKVKCIKCGLEFTTKVSHNHINNCPYCSHSSAHYNQLEKLRKVCNEHNLELLDDNYKIFDSSDKRPRYNVRCKICGTEYTTTFIGHDVVNCPTCCERKCRSNIERQITTLLDSYGITYYPNYRSHELVSDKGRPFELDIFIPSKSVAFEFNGQAYHNSGNGVYHKDKNYHKRKTEICLEHGIKLYHLWDFTPFMLIESVVRAKIGLTERIFARNCTVKEVSNDTASDFFTKYHIDGHVRANKYYALFHKESIVCCISLLKRNIQATKSSVWEIGRFATVFNITVVGGYSRLLSHAIDYLKSLEVTELISYCNRDLSPDYHNTFYFKHGFEFIQDSGLIYWYWSSKTNNLIGFKSRHSDKVSRQLCQKQKLIKVYKDNALPFDESMTEIELAGNLGLYPCYNSGNFKYRLIL